MHHTITIRRVLTSSKVLTSLSALALMLIILLAAVHRRWLKAKEEGRSRPSACSKGPRHTVRTPPPSTL